jgi:hypothetical protein
MNIKQSIKNIWAIISNLTWSKVKQFFRSLYKWARSGFKVSAVATQRQEICNECPHFKADRCTLCGCYTPAKTKWFTEECPIEKW